MIGNGTVIMESWLHMTYKQEFLKIVWSLSNADACSVGIVTSQSRVSFFPASNNGKGDVLTTEMKPNQKSALKN